MLDMSDVILNPDIAQTFTVYRRTGSWNDGRWAGTESSISVEGVVSVASPEDLQQLPEADRLSSTMVFHATVPLYAEDKTQDIVADEMLWNGRRYRTVTVYPYGDYGYYKALAARMGGA